MITRAAVTRAVALLAVLVAAFGGLLWAFRLPDPPACRGLVALLASTVLFRALGRFEPPRT